MPKFLIVFFFLTVYLTATAQINFEKGYFVNKEDVKGSVLYKKWIAYVLKTE